MLKPKNYRNALDAQSAINLSGVVHEFSRVISEIWDEAHKIGEGTSWVNEHPISRLYAEQIAHLSGGVACVHGGSYDPAYAACVEGAKEASADAAIEAADKVLGTSPTGRLDIAAAEKRVLDWATDKIAGTSN